MSTGKVFLGVLAGVAAGAILGVLVAPAKGSTTRRKIIGRGEEKIDDLSDEISEVVGDLSTKFDKLKVKVKQNAEKDLQVL
jgi:gas vesicle protein